MPRYDDGDEPRAARASDANWQTQIKANGEAPSLPALPLEDDDASDSPVDRVFAILDANRDAERAVVKLFRVTGANKYEWCDDYPVPDFESGGFRMIRETWGPGDYEIRLYGVNARGMYGVLAKPRVTVAPSPNAVKVAPAAPAVSPELLAMMRQMQEQNAAIVSALSQRPDPMANMQTTFAILAQAKDLFGGGSQKSSIGEIVAAMRELRAVNEEINPAPPGDPDNPMSLLPGVFDLVKSAMENRAQVAATAPPVTLSPAFVPPVSLPATIAAAPVALPASEQPSNVDPNAMNVLTLMTLRAQFNELCALADRNADASEGAAMLYEKLPDDMIPLLRAPNWFEMLQQFVPEAATDARRAWLTAARDIALRDFDADAPDVARPMNQG